MQALLREAAAQVFCVSTMHAIIDEFPQVSYFDLAARDPIPGTIFVREIFAIGHTRTAKELTAVAQIPTSRIVRGLGLLTENVSADAMSPTNKATLQSLLCILLRRMFTPWHVPMPDIAHDQWFRTKVLPIVADEDGHVVGATSAASLALATGKLDVCVQGLFGAGKSRAAALCVARRKFQTNSPELTLWNWPAAGAIFKMSLAERGLWNFCVARRKFQTMGPCQVRVHLLAQQQLSSLHICQQSA